MILRGTVSDDAAGMRPGGKGRREPVTDEQIIARVRAGETRLFEELVRRYQDKVYALAARMVGGTGDAEDIAQEAFLKAFRGLEGFKGEAKFPTWLYRITWNLGTDWLRRNRKPGRRDSSIEEAGEVPDSRVDVAGKPAGQRAARRGQQGARRAAGEVPHGRDAPLLPEAAIRADRRGPRAACQDRRDTAVSGASDAQGEA